MKTIKELYRYLEDECYQLKGIGIENHETKDGIIIEKNGDSYDFCSIERGLKSVIKSFDNEESLVGYAYEILSSNDDYRAHLAAWVWDENSILKAEDELKKRGIAFKRNDIPGFTKEKDAYRIFVFGKDVMKIGFLKDKYWKIYD